MRPFRIPGTLKNNLHFVWIIVFFIINGYNQQEQEIAFSQILILFFILVAASGLFFRVFTRFFSSTEKAALLTSLGLILILFFGVYQDFIGSLRAVADFAKLPLLMSIVFAIILAFLVWLRFTTARFARTGFFISRLFHIYILVELLILLYEMLPLQKKIVHPDVLTSCATCSKPDVYLIVLDEYFGSAGLKDYYGYDNSAFELFLERKGFSVLSGTKSNYSLTVFSMASMLNMDYLRNLGEISLKNHYAYVTATAGIQSSAVVRKFRAEGYSIKNKSQFHMHDAPSDYSTGLLPTKIQFINSKTLYYKVAKHLPSYFAKNHGIKWFAKRVDEKTISKNREILDDALEEAGRPDSVPTFTYIHLYMPHDPFAFDSTGKQMVPLSQRKSFTPNDVDEAYLQYLVYTNKRIGDFVHQLLKATGGEAVILLMGDHGYRFAVHKGYNDIFQTLNAVYIPGKSANGWYDGMTNVNQFRVLFNTLFAAGLPVLKDSTVR